MESLIGYYSSGRVAIKKLLLAVLFRGPASPRNAVGETRSDSPPIVLALSSECGRVINHLLARSVVFEAIRNATPRGEGVCDKVRSFCYFLCERESASTFAR